MNICVWMCVYLYKHQGLPQFGPHFFIVIVNIYFYPSVMAGKHLLTNFQF